MATTKARPWLGWGIGALVVVLAGGGYAYTQRGTPASTTPHGVATGGSVPGQKGVIVDGLFEEPNLLNPIAGPTETYSDMVITTMFANLYYTSPSGQIVPRLATQVPTVQNGGISKNGLVYTFNLRHTEWSNGQPFTAKDVWVTWKVATSPGFVSSTPDWSYVQNVKILSPYKFQVILTKPFQPLIADLFATDYPGIVPYSVFKNLRGKAANQAAYNEDPTVSNGPFKLLKWVSGTSITVVPNPHWAGPKPKAKQIVFKIVPNDNTLLADAQARSINVFYFDPVEDVHQLQQIPGASVHFTVQPAWEGITLNLRNPFLQNLKVREALQMAIDQKALVTKVWDGHALAAAADQPPDSWAHNPGLKPYTFNLKKAKQLLLSAGFKMGPNNVLEKNGKPFTLVYATTSQNPWRALDQRLIQFWFSQIGVKVTIKDYPANAYFGSVLPSGKGWDMGEFEYAEGLDPEAGMQPMYQTGGVSNFGNYSNPALDRLFATASSQTTQAARQATLRQAESIIHNTLPQLFLYSPQEIDTSIDMTGYVPNPWMIDTWNAYAWATANG